MWRRHKPRFDSASAISKGRRDTQEDAVVVDFPVGMDTGFAVLADGMGGHSAGDVASRFAITQLYAALKFTTEQYADYPAMLPKILTHGLDQANTAIRVHVDQNPSLRGMGSTLIALAMVEARVHWLSVGDSPLYLMRNGNLKRLNQNHSHAHDLDMMAEAGQISEDEAKYHPQRSALTSAIAGGQIAQIDCPEKAFDLHAGDIILMASDGLQFLDDRRIERIMQKHRRRKAADIASHLMAAVEALGDPDQDNVSLSLIKVNHVRPSAARAAVVQPTFRSRRTRHPSILSSPHPVV